MSNLTQFIIKFLLLFVQVLKISLIFYIILSWLPIKLNSPLQIVVKITHAIVEPMLIPIRKLIEKSILGGKFLMLDFSPLIVFLILDSIRYIIDSYIS